MNKTKQLALEAIAITIENLQKEITASVNVTDNLTRAEAIKRLAEAYHNVSKG